MKPRELRELAVLTACQALYYVVASLLTTVGGLAGEALAHHRSLSTGAIAASAAVATVFAIPSTVVVKRLGRRRGLAVGNLLGVAAGVVSVVGAWTGQFAVVVAGGAMFGVLAAFAANYRFAAAEAVSEGFRSRAISINVASGIVAALIGPTLVRLARGGGGVPPFVLPYAVIAVLCGVSALLLFALRQPPAPAPAPASAPGTRPSGSFGRALAVPRYAMALVSSTCGWAIMNLVMVAAPLAMKHGGLELGAIGFGLQCHYVAMYAPSLFTGTLIARLGADRVAAAGALAMGAAGAVALGRDAAWAYPLVLGLVGLGWNLAYVASTAMAASSIATHEQAQVQGIYNLTVLVAVSVSAFSAGAVVDRFGWHAIALIALTLVGLWLLAMAVLAAAHRSLGPASAAARP